MIKHEISPQIAVFPLTAPSAHVEIHSTSRPDRSDKNGLATGRKNRRKAVFAFVDL
jgi:hypothetical protein